MSTPSKRRRKAREAIAREAERQALPARREAYEARSAAESERRRADRLMGLLEVTEGPVYPQGRPDHAIYAFYDKPNAPPRLDQFLVPRLDQFLVGVELHPLKVRAVPMAIRVGNVDVRWWGWEGVR